METYYLKVKETKVVVPVEIYKTCRKINRRYRYLKHKDSVHGLMYFSSLDTCDLIGEEMIADPTVDVEETVVAKIMGEQVRRCLLSLTEDEREIIRMLFEAEMSENALAKALGIPRTTLQSRKYAILAKLKQLMEDS